MCSLSALTVTETVRWFTSFAESHRRGKAALKSVHSRNEGTPTMGRGSFERVEIAAWAIPLHQALLVSFATSCFFSTGG